MITRWLGEKPRSTGPRQRKRARRAVLGARSVWPPASRTAARQPLRSLRRSPRQRRRRRAGGVACTSGRHDTSSPRPRHRVGVGRGRCNGDPPYAVITPFVTAASRVGANPGARPRERATGRCRLFIFRSQRHLCIGINPVWQSRTRAPAQRARDTRARAPRESLCDDVVRDVARASTGGASRRSRRPSERKNALFPPAWGCGEPSERVAARFGAAAAEEIEIFLFRKALPGRGPPFLKTEVPYSGAPRIRVFVLLVHLCRNRYAVACAESRDSGVSCTGWAQD